MKRGEDAENSAEQNLYLPVRYRGMIQTQNKNQYTHHEKYTPNFSTLGNTSAEQLRLSQNGRWECRKDRYTT